MISEIERKYFEHGKINAHELNARELEELKESDKYHCKCENSIVDNDGFITTESKIVFVKKDGADSSDEQEAAEG